MPDLAGVDWREYEDDDTPAYVDSGLRPALPAGWPAVDGELLAAVAEVAIIHGAIAAPHKEQGDEADGREDFQALENRRWAAINVLATVRAQSFVGCERKPRR